MPGRGESLGVSRSCRETDYPVSVCRENTMEDKCFFEKLYSCLEKDPLSQTSAERIMRASKQYGDGLHTELEQQQKIAGSIESVLVHCKCVDKYCQKKTIQKVLHEKAQSANAEDLVSKPAQKSKTIRAAQIFVSSTLSLLWRKMRCCEGS